MTLTAGNLVLANPLLCTNIAKGDNKLYSDAKGVVPSLDLRFASQKNLNDYMTGQNLITFSRPVGTNQSPGTYLDENGIIQLSSADTPRFDHDPTTGESLGLLIEESRTNLITHSEEFGNAAWYKNGVTVTPNTHTAPDGTITADTLAGGGVSNAIARGSLALPSTGVYYASCYFRKTTGATVFPGVELNFVPGNAFVVLNTNTGIATGAQGTPLNILVSSVGDYWRLSFGANVTSFTNAYLYIYPCSSSDGVTLTQNLTGSCVAWGAQVEAGSFPTSYIPTTGTALTRSADVASITGSSFSSWYNQSEGTAFCDFVPQRGNTTQAWAVQFGNTTTTGPNSFVIGKISNSLAYAETRINSVAQYSVSLSVPTGAMRVAYGVKNLDHRAAFNGQLAAASAGSFAPLSSDNLYIGRAVNNTQCLGGTIARLTYFPERLPDATLQAITA